MIHIEIHTDGACDNVRSRMMGVGVHISVKLLNGHTRTITIAENYGWGTSNKAEWIGLLRGLEIAVGLKEEYTTQTTVAVKMDSQLVIRQVTGEYQIGKPEFVPMNEMAQKLVEILSDNGKVTFHWISRDKNEVADLLSKEALEKPQQRLNIYGRRF